MNALLETVFGFDVFMPVIWLFVGAALCVSIEIGAKDRAAVRLPVFFCALGSIVLGLVSLWMNWKSPDVPQTILEGGVKLDRLGLFLCGGILIGTAICCLSVVGVIEKLRIGLGDFLALVLVAAAGMLLLVVSNDLIMVFLSIELMSLAIYVLAGCNRASGRSAEAAMKYFVMGAFASGFLVLGMALIYGMTGEVNLAAVGHALNELTGGEARVALLGIGLVLIGFAFKVGAVPFHQWVPDVYTGAPTPVTGFMAVAVKFAAFGALGRFVLEAFPASLDGKDFAPLTMGLVWWLAALSMVFGNWFAVTQENVKRMLAYSSIAHSGYLLMGILASLQLANTAGGHRGDGMEAILFYLLVYAFATGGAFAILTYLAPDGADDGQELRGIGKQSPMVALAMSIFMLSLAGIPLTGGFIGKYLLFASAIDAGEITLAIIGIASSIIGAFYYLRVVVVMYMKDPSPAQSSNQPALDHWAAKLAMLGTTAATIIIGILPNALMERASFAAKTVLESATVQAPDKGRLTGEGEVIPVNVSRE